MCIAGVSGHLNSTLARKNTSVGTPYWMAPEVRSNQIYESTLLRTASVRVLVRLERVVDSCTRRFSDLLFACGKNFDFQIVQFYFEVNMCFEYYLI